MRFIRKQQHESEIEIVAKTVNQQTRKSRRLKALKEHVNNRKIIPQRVAR